MNTSLQLEMGLSSPHRNRYLFSDHYLEHILPDDPRWDEALREAEMFLAWVQALYGDEREQLEDYSETQLEQYWFRPILEQLGHVFEVQPTVPGLDEHAKRPDYVFFPDESTRQEAARLQNQEEYADSALVVGEVKRWDRAMGKKRRGGGPSFEDRNPSWQIDYYLRTTGLGWGILTNGRLWRLVHHDTSHRLQIYYEVDLVQLITEGDAERLRYFTLFFRQAAFRPDDRGRVFVDDALAASNQYAVELEEDLEDNVYRALERLMQGFLDLPANELGHDDLREIYDNSLYLLYRLLFILYGESRGLLPLDNDQYRTNYSLSRIKGEIAELDFAPAPRTTLYWGHLKNLFHIINGDDAELNRSLGVPRYNGGLFDPEQHPFLEETAVGDRALVEAIDLVSRRATDKGREFADYRTLGVRHLGSIYEGLLEYQPRVAEAPVVVIRDGGDERWVPANEAPEDARVIERRRADQVYLETDRGERKATGSYYTPQYVVEYIVEHAVGPLVDEAVERVKGRAKAAKTKAARVEAEQSLIEEILDLKVLDPAMGSGHFLVEAMEHLALALATDPYVETAETPEEDLTHWKRRVVERCIYGVDKNPLAVELAKLSLWLATVAADRPLSFLDHHLKCGDSLIGARVEDLGWAPPPVLSKKAQKQVEQQKAGQINMFEHVLSQMLPTVMGRILEITEEESKDYDTVRAKEAADQAVRELKAPFEAVADLWTSGYFGNAFAPGDYDEALGIISQPNTLLGLEPVERAQEMARARRFFHWELAFPEVFYDENGQRLGEQVGFDAVVGNPPYVTTLDRDQREYFFAWSETRGRELDTFYLFVEQATRLLRRAGWCSMIIPNVFMLQIEAETFRRYLLRQTIDSLADYGFSVFGSATVPTAVLTLSKSAPLADHAVHVEVQSEESLEIEQSFFSNLPNVQFNAQIKESLSLLDKIGGVSNPLAFYAESHEGVHSGNIRDKLFTREPGLPCARRMLKGSDIDRYSLQWGGWYVNYDASLIDRSEGGYASLRDERIFTDPKIWTRQTADGIIATWDDQGFYSDNTLHSTQLYDDATISPLFLLALLNSRLLTFVYRERTQERGRTLAQVKIAFLSQLPVRCIEFTTPTEERERLVAAGIAGATEWVEGTEKRSMESVSLRAFRGSDFGRWLDERLSAEPEQSDVVHDLLAHLAERMIAMHEEKQEREEAFWLDLEGVTDAETFEALKEHGKWESSLWKAEACRPFVDEESRSTRHLDESLEWNERCFKAFVKMLAGRVSNLSEVVAVYRKHHPKYGALIQCIETTDRLIDLMVYRLYGLTEDDVAVVEWKS